MIQLVCNILIIHMGVFTSRHRTQPGTAKPLGDISTLGSTRHREKPVITTVRLKVEKNQLVNVFGEIGVLVDRLEGA